MGCEQRPPAARRWVYERLWSVVPCECSALKDILQIGESRRKTKRLGPRNPAHGGCAYQLGSTKLGAARRGTHSAAGAAPHISGGAG
jgi:hypothetical protein